MFGRCPRLPVDYYFLTVSTFECSHRLPAYVTDVRMRFKEAYAEAHLQMNCEAEKQERYYNRAMSTMQLVLGDIVLMKNDVYQGKQKVKDRWSETEYVVVRQVADCVPAYEGKDEAGNVKDRTLQLAVSCGHPNGGCHTLGGRCVNFRGKRCSIHPCGTYLIRGREQFTRGIRRWG